MLLKGIFNKKYLGNLVSYAITDELIQFETDPITEKSEIIQDFKKNFS